MFIVVVNHLTCPVGAISSFFQNKYVYRGSKIVLVSSCHHTDVEHHTGKAQDNILYNLYVQVFIHMWLTSFGYIFSRFKIVFYQGRSIG